MFDDFPLSIIYHCSACSKPIREQSVTGNSDNIRVWSDGKEEGEALPDSDWLVLCPHCDAAIWMDELEGMEEFGDDIDEKTGLPGTLWPDLDNDDADADADATEPLPYKVPGFADYLAALPAVARYADKVFDLRMHAWWAGNDRRRTPALAEPLAQEEVANLQALMHLLDTDNPYECLLKAEALRELGRFAEAAQLLQACNDPDMARAVAVLAEAVAQQDVVVRLLVN